MNDDGMKALACLSIKVYANGALSIEGPMDDPQWCLSVLEHAKDAIKNRIHMMNNTIIIPERDVSL